MEGYLAQIILFAGNFAPRGWAFCQGQILSIAQNTALFSLLGTTYGGNGQTTFALPDLRGCVPIGTGQGPGLTPRTLGEKAGSETQTLITPQLPAHTHSLKATTAVASSGDPSSKLLASTKSSTYASGTATTMDATAIAPTGGNQPVSIMQPYLGLNYIICVEGIYPSRD